MQKLTNSRVSTFKTCRMQHKFAYEDRIRPTDEARALRMGSVFHDALEALANGKEMIDALEIVEKRYAVVPEKVPDDEWAFEHETIRRLVNAYAWRWSDSNIEYLAAEQVFSLPLINPETGRPTPNFSDNGKIDGIVRLPDGRLAVIEHKLLGEDIGPDASLWQRMQMDNQISKYVIAARRIGYEIDTVLYDVARKPTIKPERVPILDKYGVKIVLDANGNRVKTQRGEFRQTGDKEKGYVLQDRDMTPEEWGKKLNNDIAERPDFYFHRQEIPRMDGDLEEYQYELWDIQKTIRDAQLGNRWYRTVSRDTCKFCSYFSLCSNRGFDPKGELPLGFERVENIHPELGDNHVNGSTSSPAETESATTAPAASGQACPL